MGVLPKLKGRRRRVAVEVAGKKAKMLPVCCAKWLSDNGVTDVTDV